MKSTTQMTFKNSYRSVTALVAMAFAFSTFMTPVAEANFWKERQKFLEKSGDQADVIQVAGLPVPSSAHGAGQLLQSLPSVQARLLGQAGSLPEFLEKKIPQEANSLRSLISALPAPYGQVRAVSLPSKTNQERIVLHIQDVHLNTEAQNNIGKTVQELIAQGKIDLVALEGAFEPLDLRRVRAFSRQDVIHRVADYLLRAHKITGPVHTALTTSREIPPFIGVDHPRLYDNNVEAYKQSALQLKERKVQLGLLEKELEQKKAAVFSPRLREYDERVQAYHKETVRLGEHLRRLVAQSAQRAPAVHAFLQALDMESGLDFRQVEAERAQLVEKIAAAAGRSQIQTLLDHSAAFRSGQLRHSDFYRFLQEFCQKNNVPLARYKAMDAYVRYVLLSDAIDAQSLFNEIQGLENAGYNALAKTPEERQLAALSKQLTLIGKLLDFSLTPEEWKEYAAKKALPVERNGGPLESQVEGFRSQLSSFEAFYSAAQARDQAMTENLLKAMERHSASSAVLVTGGFHSHGMDQLLTRSGVATVSFTPKITQVETKKGSAYLSVFTQEKTPLEKLFQGEKLFLTKKVYEEAVQKGLIPAGAAAIIKKEERTLQEVEESYKKLEGPGHIVGSSQEGNIVRLSVHLPGEEIENTVEFSGDEIVDMRSSTGYAKTLRAIALAPALVLAGSSLAFAGWVIGEGAQTAQEAMATAGLARLADLVGSVGGLDVIVSLGFAGAVGISILDNILKSSRKTDRLAAGLKHQIKRIRHQIERIREGLRLRHDLPNGVRKKVKKFLSEAARALRGEKTEHTPEEYIRMAREEMLEREPRSLESKEKKGRAPKETWVSRTAKGIRRAMTHMNSPSPESVAQAFLDLDRIAHELRSIVEEAKKEKDFKGLSQAQRWLEIVIARQKQAIKMLDDKHQEIQQDYSNSKEEYEYFIKNPTHGDSKGILEIYKHRFTSFQQAFISLQKANTLRGILNIEISQKIVEVGQKIKSIDETLNSRDLWAEYPTEQVRIWSKPTTTVLLTLGVFFLMGALSDVFAQGLGAGNNGARAGIRFLFNPALPLLGIFILSKAGAFSARPSQAPEEPETNTGSSARKTAALVAEMVAQKGAYTGNIATRLKREFPPAHSLGLNELGVDAKGLEFLRDLKEQADREPGFEKAFSEALSQTYQNVQPPTIPQALSILNSVMTGSQAPADLSAAPVLMQFVTKDNIADVPALLIKHEEMNKIIQAAGGKSLQLVLIAGESGLPLNGIKNNVKVVSDPAFVQNGFLDVEGFDQWFNDSWKSGSLLLGPLPEGLEFDRDIVRQWTADSEVKRALKLLLSPIERPLPLNQIMDLAVLIARYA